MIRLMPYSPYEFEAMNRFLEQMANKGWQYCGRFLCVMRFQKQHDAKAPVCVPYHGKAHRAPLHLYRSDWLSEDVALRPADGDAPAEPFSASLKETTIVELVLHAILIVAIGIFSAFCCRFSGWDSMNALWAMREVASLLLPCAGCLMIDQVSLFVRLVKLKRFKKCAHYEPMKSTLRYVCLLLAVLSVAVQLAAGATARPTRYDTSAAPDTTVLANRFLLEPESWEARLHTANGSVRITYHRCLTAIGAENYLAQFRNDNADAESMMPKADDPSVLTVQDGTYYAAARVWQNEVVLISLWDVDDPSGFADQILKDLDGQPRGTRMTDTTSKMETSSVGLTEQQETSTETNEYEEQLKVIHSLEEFADIHVGTQASERNKIVQFPIACQTSRGAVYIFQLDDGRYIGFVCMGDRVQTIEFYDSAPFRG